MKIAFFDTKSYWVDAFKPVAAKYGYEITFFNERRYSSSGSRS